MADVVCVTPDVVLFFLGEIIILVVWVLMVAIGEVGCYIRGRDILS